MTLQDFERLVLKLANQTPTRFWRHWNHPTESPWFMAVAFHADSGRVIGELESLGLRRSPVPMPDGATLFSVERDQPSHRCAVCGQYGVDAEGGYDTCDRPPLPNGGKP
jgi:hypothetical protein